MALMKCPDCGKIVSSRAKTCPNCGCPAEFFEQMDEENVSSTSNVSQQDDNSPEIDDQENEEDNKPKKSFDIAGYTLSISKKYKEFASVFGGFSMIAYKTVQGFDEFYKNHSIVEILSELPNNAQSGLSATLELVEKILYEANCNISQEAFIERYYYDYNLDYSREYSDVVEQYATICNEGRQLQNYRDAEKAARGRWQGGGFGLKGALKGAAIAGILNAGQDFLNSFGDSEEAYKDNQIIQNKLSQLKSSSSTHDKLVNGIGRCIEGYFFALIAELQREHSNYFEIYDLDKKSAEALFQNTIKFEENREKYVDNVLDCILDYPAEKKYYDAIMPEIMEGDPYQFLAFLKFWNIEYLYPSLEEDLKEQKKEQKATEKADIFAAKQLDSEILDDISCENYVIIKRMLFSYNYKHEYDRYKDSCNANLRKEAPLIKWPENSKYYSRICEFINRFRGSRKLWGKSYALTLESISKAENSNSPEKFFYSLHRNRFFLWDYLFYSNNDTNRETWIYGDSQSDKANIVHGEEKLKFNENDEILFYSDSSFTQLGGSGIALTRCGVIDLKTKIKIEYKNISEITLYESKGKFNEALYRIIIISQDGSSITYGGKNGSDDINISFFEKILRTYCVCITHNYRLWVREMGIPNPLEDAPSSIQHSEKIVAEDDPFYKSFKANMTNLINGTKCLRDPETIVGKDVIHAFKCVINKPLDKCFSSEKNYFSKIDISDQYVFYFDTVEGEPNVVLTSQHLIYRNKVFDLKNILKIISYETINGAPGLVAVYLKNGEIFTFSENMNQYYWLSSCMNVALMRSNSNMEDEYKFISEQNDNRYYFCSICHGNNVTVTDGIFGKKYLCNHCGKIKPKDVYVYIPFYVNDLYPKELKIL